MINPIASEALFASTFVLQVGLLLVILHRRVWRRFAGPFLYVLAMLVVETILRPLTLYSFGLRSFAYYAVYWYTHVALELATLLLACAFVRRASGHYPGVQALYLLPVLTGGLIIVAWTHSFRLDHGAIRILAGLSSDLQFTDLLICVTLWIVLCRSQAVGEELKLLVAGLAMLQASWVIGNVDIAFAQGAFGVFEFVSGMLTLFFLLLWWKAVILPPAPSPA